MMRKLGSFLEQFSQVIGLVRKMNGSASSPKTSNAENISTGERREDFYRSLNFWLSMAICMGDFHKTTWQGEGLLDVAPGSTCTGSLNSLPCCTEPGMDKNECQTPATIIGEQNCVNNSPGSESRLLYLVGYRSRLLVSR